MSHSRPREVLLYSPHFVELRARGDAAYRAVPPLSHLALAGPLQQAGDSVRIIDSKWDLDWRREVPRARAEPRRRRRDVAPRAVRRGRTRVLEPAGLLPQSHAVEEDIAEAALFLTSARSGKTTDAVLPVVGGVKEAFPR